MPPGNSVSGPFDRECKWYGRLTPMKLAAIRQRKKNADSSLRSPQSCFNTVPPTLVTHCTNFLGRFQEFVAGARQISARQMFGLREYAIRGTMHNQPKFQHLADASPS